MKYEFGLRGHDIGNNFEEMCENAKKYGVKNLQFAMARTCNDINFDEIGFDEKVANDIKAKLDEYGFTGALTLEVFRSAREDYRAMSAEAFLATAYDRIKRISALSAATMDEIKKEYA